MRVKQSNMIGPGGLISMEDGVVGGWVQRATRNDHGTSLLEMGGRCPLVTGGRHSRWHRGYCHATKFH